MATLIIHINNDPVPGAFHTDESVRDGVQAILENQVGHYDPQVSLADGDNRTHFTFDDGYDVRMLLVNVTDEGVIMDAFLNEEHVGTSAMMAEELFESIATGEEAEDEDVTFCSLCRTQHRQDWSCNKAQAHKDNNKEKD